MQWKTIAVMVVQHHGRTCQQKFPTKSIETGKPGFSVRV